MKQLTEQPAQVLQSTVPAIIAPPSTINNNLIIGAAVGGVVLFICGVILLYLFVKRSRASSHNRKRSKDKERLDEVTHNLVEIFEAGNKYEEKSRVVGSYGDGVDTGYVKLTTSTVETEIYSEPDDSSLPETSSKNSNKVSTFNSSPKEPAWLKINLKQKPEVKPKPKLLKCQQPDSLVNNTVLDNGAGRKPMPTPRSKSSNQTFVSTSELPESREAENFLYGCPDNRREAENMIYSQPECIDDDTCEKVYEDCSKVNTGPVTSHTLDLQRAHPGTSARMLNQYNPADIANANDAEQKFAIYVPVGRTEAIYKVPTGLERHEAPSVVPGEIGTSINSEAVQEQNVMQDFYMNMGDIEPDSPQSVPDYEDVSEFFGTDYETMTSCKNNGNIYQDLTVDEEPYQYGNEVII